MTFFLRSFIKLFRSGRWPLAVVLALGLSGCKNWDLRGEGCPNDEMSASVRKARSEEGGKENDAESWFFNEKARQIDRDFRRQ